MGNGESGLPVKLLEGDIQNRSRDEEAADLMERNEIFCEDREGCGGGLRATTRSAYTRAPRREVKRGSRSRESG